MEENKITNRRYDLDNIRWFVVSMVFLHHICYMFNSEGLRGHFWAEGIPVLDLFSHVVYPWFMAILFLLAGISMKYSMEHRTIKEIRKERYRKLMKPFLWGMFLLSPIIAYHMFVTGGTLSEIIGGMGNVPAAVKYIQLWFMCFLIGMAQLWFIGELYIFSRIFLWFTKRKMHTKLIGLSQKCCKDSKSISVTLLVFGIIFVFLCKTVDWCCSANYTILGMILVLRPLVYLFLYLIGYYFFSQKEVTDYLQSKAIILSIAAVVLCVMECLWFYPASPFAITSYDYTISCDFIFVAVYAYVAILAILSLGRWINKCNRFTSYMTKRSFYIYFFHYIVLMFTGDFVANYLGVKGAGMYLLTLLLGVAGTIAITEIWQLLLRLKKKRKEARK